MQNRPTKTDVFLYTDYRSFLRDWYEAGKVLKTISLRLFSQRAGFTSPNYLKMVMDGDRNLTTDSIDKFALALELNKQEQEFFRNLVFYNQAVSHDDKDSAYQQLLQSRKYNKLKPIEKEQYAYYSEWYHPVVRELVIAPDYRNQIDILANRISPAITVQQAKKSIELLEKLGFIKRDGDNWVQSKPVVSTGGESDSLTLLNYHQSILDLTKRVLTQIPQEARDVSALTLGITKDRLPELKQRIQAFRQDILNLVADDVHPEQVVLLTMQLIPVTQDEGLL